VTRPWLVLVCGLPGSGKTTTALRIAAELGGVRLCPDDWLAHLGLDGHDTAAREKVEGLQWELTQDLLRAGQNVVLEWGFWAMDERAGLRDRARELGARVELRYLDVGLAELWRRLAARNAAKPAGSVPVTREQLATYASCFQAPTVDELKQFDGSRDLTDE
jgi:predicted kinase